ncbi:MAG: HDOD domain-containing protein [Candidatus Competibacteraceae bacterium]|jgi:nitrogen-specific signal transduction histidine kinase/HD-like signal output (HDOD) protein|nr:HDOD domain-containing protein [Candidatus Competibacteraceae bacterium]
MELIKLPSPPGLLNKIIELTLEEEVSREKLLPIISIDIALTAKIMEVHCTEFTAGQKKPSSLHGTIKKLHFDAVKNIVMVHAIEQFFSSQPIEDNSHFRKIWQDSLHTAIAAQLIAEVVNYPSPEEAYTCGLLHNIGQLMLANIFQAKYDQFLVKDLNPDELISLEQEHCGISHTKFGAQLINAWNLRSFMADAVLYHHEPAHKIMDAHELVKIVNLANLVAVQADPPSDDEIFATAIQALNLNRSTIMDLLVETRKTLSLTIDTLDLDIDESNKTKENQQEKMLRLGDKLRDIILVNELSWKYKNDMDDLLKNAHRNLIICLGIRDIVFFLYDNTSNSIYNAHPINNILSSHAFKIPLKKSRSLLSDALLTRKTLNSLSENSVNLTIIDQQIIRILQNNGMICIPLLIQDKRIGVIALGANEEELRKTQSRQGLVTVLMHRIAESINVAQTNQEQGGLTKEREKLIQDAQLKVMIHEANNPLSILRNYISIISFKLDKNDAVQDDLRVIREEIDRIGDIIRRFSCLDKDQPHDIKAVDINRFITDLIKVMQRSFFASGNIKTQLELDQSLPQITTDPHALKQILTNLIMNTIEAIPTSETLAISTQDNVILNGSAFIEITLRDKGPGIPSHILANLFKPVISTKGKDHSGMGLHIVKNLIDELKGHISCRSNAKSGTVFQILLPRICNS